MRVDEVINVMMRVIYISMPLLIATACGSMATTDSQHLYKSERYEEFGYLFVRTEFGLELNVLEFSHYIEKCDYFYVCYRNDLVFAFAAPFAVADGEDWNLQGDNFSVEGVQQIECLGQQVTEYRIRRSGRMPEIVYDYSPQCGIRGFRFIDDDAYFETILPGLFAHRS